jgi:hypothetical protein
MLLTLTILPHLIGIIWAIARRSALMLVVAIIVQRIGFIFFFASMLTDVSQHSPEGAPFILLFLLLAIANTATLLEVALVSAGLRKRMRK